MEILKETEATDNSDCVTVCVCECVTVCVCACVCVNEQLRERKPVWTVKHVQKVNY